MGYTVALGATAFGYRGSTPLSGTKIMPYILLLEGSWHCQDCNWFYPENVPAKTHECWVPSDFPELILVDFEFTHLPIWRRLSNGVYRHSRHDSHRCVNCDHFMTQHVFISGRWTCMTGMGCMCIHQLRTYEIKLREEDLLRVKDIEDLEDQFEPRPE